MVVPTPLELKTEIENGPLKDELAPFWSDVFADDFTNPTIEEGETQADYDSRLLRWLERKDRLMSRQGMLKPDAIWEIMTRLNDPTRVDKVVTEVSRSVFVAIVMPLTLKVAQIENATIRSKWELRVQLITALGDVINLANPMVQGLFTDAVNDGLMTQDIVNLIMSLGGVSKQSQCSYKGWANVTQNQIHEAKMVV